jgi:hypothetical protein
MDAASETLVEAVPADFELRASGRRGHVTRDNRALLPKKA